MTVSMLADPGGLFVRLAELSKVIRRINHYQREIETITGELLDQYNDNRKLYERIKVARDQHLNAQLIFPKVLQDVAKQTVIKMVNDDNPQKDRLLETAMRELVVQMFANTDRVSPGWAIATNTKPGPSTFDETLGGELVDEASGANNYGNGIVLIYMADPKLFISGGYDLGFIRLAYAYAEDLNIICISDSQTGGRLEGQEVFQSRGEAYIEEKLGHKWTLNSTDTPYQAKTGSGSGFPIVAVSPASNRNMIENGDFENWTDNIPDNWYVELNRGIPGQHIFQSSSSYTGSSSIQFVGGNPNPIQIFQEFKKPGKGAGAVVAPLTAVSNGSSKRIFTNTVYSISCWVKTENSPTKGDLRIQLMENEFAVNWGGGTVTVNLNTITSTWTNVNFILTTFAVRLPGGGTRLIIPDTLRLQIRVRNLENAKSVFIDRLTMTELEQLYPGGPLVAVHSGSTKFIKGDKFTANINWENRIGEGDGGLWNDASWRVMFERLFDLSHIGIQLPCSNVLSSETTNIFDLLLQLPDGS